MQQQWSCRQAALWLGVHLFIGERARLLMAFTAVLRRAMDEPEHNMSSSTCEQQPLSLKLAGSWKQLCTAERSRTASAQCAAASLLHTGSSSYLKLALLQLAELRWALLSRQSSHSAGSIGGQAPVRGAQQLEHGLCCTRL